MNNGGAGHGVLSMMELFDASCAEEAEDRWRLRETVNKECTKQLKAAQKIAEVYQPKLAELQNDYDMTMAELNRLNRRDVY